MQNFEMHPALAKKTFVCDLPLCRILLENNKIFPWIFLVPRVSKVSQINHLSFADQLKLIGELNFASEVMEKLFPCDRLNVAAIGNKTDQLHIHVICRFIDDPHWPDTVCNIRVKKWMTMKSMSGLMICVRLSRAILSSFRLDIFLI
jgi:diadenosine tetraphosphate (Ap4A) HIT family hydrolase